MAGASVREACHEASRLISVVLIIGVTFPGLSYRVLTYLHGSSMRTYVCIDAQTWSGPRFPMSVRPNGSSGYAALRLLLAELDTRAYLCRY